MAVVGAAAERPVHDPLARDIGVLDAGSREGAGIIPPPNCGSAAEIPVLEVVGVPARPAALVPQIGAVENPDECIRGEDSDAGEIPTAQQGFGDPDGVLEEGMQPGRPWKLVL